MSEMAKGGRRRAYDFPGVAQTADEPDIQRLGYTNRAMLAAAVTLGVDQT
jgi:hypothetical protein